MARSEVISSTYCTNNYIYLEGLPTKAKEDPSPYEMRLSPTGGIIINIIIIYYCFNPLWFCFSASGNMTTDSKIVWHFFTFIFSHFLKKVQSFLKFSYFLEIASRFKICWGLIRRTPLVVFVFCFCFFFKFSIKWRQFNFLL